MLEDNRLGSTIATGKHRRHAVQRFSKTTLSLPRRGRGSYALATTRFPNIDAANRASIENSDVNKSSCAAPDSGLRPEIVGAVAAITYYLLAFKSLHMFKTQNICSTCPNGCISIRDIDKLLKLPQEAGYGTEKLSKLPYLAVYATDKYLKSST